MIVWLHRFMKLRLDRVLSESYEADTLEEALVSKPVNLEFEKPENWVAPYPKYEFGWWEPFLPPGSVKPKAWIFIFHFLAFPFTNMSFTACNLKVNEAMKKKRFAR